MRAAGVLAEPAPAKLNLALHVRGKRADGLHDLETIFAFCTDGDQIAAEPADGLSLDVTGPFAGEVSNDEHNIVWWAARGLRGLSGATPNAAISLTKCLPVSSGIGGGSADAAAALRLLTRLWDLDPTHAAEIAPGLGSDVPACLLSMTARGTGAGDQLQLVDDPTIAGTPVLLVNPRVPLSTHDVFAAWDGVDRGPLGDWREGRNDLEAPARTLVPAIGEVLDWLNQRDGANFIRMSGSGATCFALFNSEDARNAAAAACPPEWWHLATFLR